MFCGWLFCLTLRFVGRVSWLCLRFLFRCCFSWFVWLCFKCNCLYVNYFVDLVCVLRLFGGVLGLTVWFVACRLVLFSLFCLRVELVFLVFEFVVVLGRFVCGCICLFACYFVGIDLCLYDCCAWVFVVEMVSNCGLCYDWRLRCGLVWLRLCVFVCLL